MRQLSGVDKLIDRLDAVLRAACRVDAPTARPTPAPDAAGGVLEDADRQRSAALMRVNHTGEVCAQALYVGQALVARDERLREVLNTAAREEADHLIWCEDRLRALGGHRSYLNPVWFAGSLGIGMFAGLFGDRASLGFLAETERQVVRHLEDHLTRLPPQDSASRVVVAAMRDDEARHATTAVQHGGSDMPEPVQRLMAWQARVMTSVAYWV